MYRVLAVFTLSFCVSFSAFAAYFVNLPSTPDNDGNFTFSWTSQSSSLVGALGRDILGGGGWDETVKV